MVIHQQSALPGFGGADRQILFERRRGFRSVRHLPLLAALAAHANPVLGGIEIVQIQPDQFADAQAAAVQQLEQKQVALRIRALQAVRGDAFTSVLVCSAVGTTGTRCGAFGVLTSRATFVGTVPSRSMNWNNERTAASLRRIVTTLSGMVVQPAEPFAQLDRIDLRAARRLPARRREIFDELLQVRGVVAQRVRRSVFARQRRDNGRTACASSDMGVQILVQRRQRSAGILRRGAAFDRAAAFRASAADRR